jgi:peptide/nickel transport system ATP-binding protein
MYRGRVVEQGPADTVLDAPKHEYTKALLAATPVPEVARP